ncbi:MAG TPA: hypothetical protein VH796_05085 [Nitrososphaeraceae archaeon]
MDFKLDAGANVIQKKLGRLAFKLPLLMDRFPNRRLCTISTNIENKAGNKRYFSIDSNAGFKSDNLNLEREVNAI